MKSIAIIGAGPAGILAALQSARAGAAVEVFEANSIIGRKLLVTGSGRCNITNLNARAEKYACNDPVFLQTILEQLEPVALRAYLADLGILTFATGDGWCYPISESAQAVADLFMAALVEAGIKFHFSTRISSLSKDSSGFILQGLEQKYRATNVIICAGGKSYSNLGSTGNLFASLKNLGHSINPILPALAPVLADMKPFQKLQGVRLDADVSLFNEAALLATTRGNLIFTSWGLNGPAVMDLSHLISKQPHSSLRLELNLLLDRKEDLRSLLDRKPHAKVSVVLGSILPPKMASFIVEYCGFTSSATWRDLNTKEKEHLLRSVTHLPVVVTGVRGFDYCQLKTGGVSLSEVDPATLQSLYIPGLYLAGETLDVAGPCGGHNLHFAFASGWLAGKSAAGL